jgi:DNA-binding transcriptional MerR regulator
VLTIGEVARLAGTIVHAVRHYHATGLLPEPDRDGSGYRRYGAAALVRLLRIRRMRELGLPLERIGGLLDGPEPDLHDALDALDAELAAQADRIAAQRTRLAALRASNPDPELPEPLGRLFAAAAADGAPPRAIQQEKEVLLLDLALHPAHAGAIVAEYERLYARLRDRPGVPRSEPPLRRAGRRDGRRCGDRRVRGAAGRDAAGGGGRGRRARALGPGGRADLPGLGTRPAARATTPAGAGGGAGRRALPLIAGKPLCRHAMA